MQLLGWYQVDSIKNTAAILFPAPVRVLSLRIFPTGAQPFSQTPDIIALTEPETFFLDVFFNANPIQPSSDSQDKRTVKNLLAPTRIAYVGGQAEFDVDMGSEYATRLIVFHGDFYSLFVAVYGEHIISKPQVDTYEPIRLPVSNPLPIPSNVDPANSPNPTLVAEQLLSLMDDPRPLLSVATRLIFSLKPEKEEWDLPEFPYLYSELSVLEDDHLEDLVASVARPIRDNISQEAITKFAMKMHDCLGSNALDDAYYTARLLCIAASQQTRFSTILLEHLYLPQVYTEESLDETNVYGLRDAASNFDIAKTFWKDYMFMCGLENLQKSSKTEKSIEKALKKLLSRIRGWQLFENALDNPEGDFRGAIEFLKDITSTELSTGCWLECMMGNGDLITKLGRASPPPALPLPLFQDHQTKISHEEFIVFVKALLGVVAVLPVLAWADSVGSGSCRERVLAILVLWQGIDGYREIVNHCLLLRQITKRLEWNTGENPPMKGGMLAERLLLGLARDPQAILREDLIDTILNLKDPFSYIETDDLLEMGKLARVARDGLPSAIEELTYTSVRPFSPRRLRVLRVSLAIIVEEASYEDGELLVVRSFWKERSQGLFPTLISVLSDISEDLNRHFEIDISARMNQALPDLLFRTADDILRLIARFALHYPIVNRDLRVLTSTIVDLYACSGTGISLFYNHSSAHSTAQNIRQTCPDILLRFTMPEFHRELELDAPQIIFRTLLGSHTPKDLRDPVHHILHLYDLIDKILQHPFDLTTTWETDVFPKVLPDLKFFCSLLDRNTRHDFIRRLIDLDDGEIGLGEWLVGEELKDLHKTLQSLQSSMFDESRTLILNHQIFNSLQFCELLVSSSHTSDWALSSLSGNEDLSQYLDSCLLHILETNISLYPFTALTRQLAKHASQFGPDVRFNILLLVLRNAESEPSVVDALDFVPDILQSLPPTCISPERLRVQVGRMLLAYSDHASSLKVDNAIMLFQTLEWLTSQDNARLTTLPVIPQESFHYLCVTLASTLSRSNDMDVSTLEKKFNIDDEEHFLPPTVELADTITLPLQSIENFFSPKPFEPSTPKSGNKTPDILGVVISPPTAILRSPAATGLTKKYANNDFRQLRQTSSTRLNTSRLPSTHVDVSTVGQTSMLTDQNFTPLVIQEFGQSQSPESPVMRASMHLEANVTTSPFQGFLPMI